MVFKSSFCYFRICIKNPDRKISDCLSISVIADFNINEFLSLKI